MNRIANCSNLFIWQIFILLEMNLADYISYYYYTTMDKGFRTVRRTGANQLYATLMKNKNHVDESLTSVIEYI